MSRKPILLREILQSFCGQFFGFQICIFHFNLFNDVLTFSTEEAVSTAYFRVRMLHALNPSSILRGYGHFVISKASFMISGASFILALNVSIAIFGNYCHEFWRNLLLQEVHETLNCGFGMQFLGLCHVCDLYRYLNVDFETSNN